jgi:hypothetical protein
VLGQLKGNLMRSPITFEKHISFVTGSVTITFVPVKKTPGFSHRVLIISEEKLVASSWLGSDFAVSLKTALYYYQKFISHEELEDV